MLFMQITLQLLTIFFYAYLFVVSYIEEDYDQKEGRIILEILIIGFLITSAVAWFIPHMWL